MNSNLINRIREMQTLSRVKMANSQRRMIATLCLASPLELVDAVGAVPVRIITSSDEAELRGGRYLASDSCSFCKAVLGGLDLPGRKPDAVLGSTTCDQMRRNLEIIARDLNIPAFIFNAPRTSDNPLSHEYAKRDFQRIIHEISAWAGVSLELDRLSAALQSRYLIRRRLKNLQEKREAVKPTLTGSEFQSIMMLFQTVPLDDFESQLPEIEELILSRKPIFQHEPLRIALLGSCAGEDDYQVIDLVEETNQAVIAYDALCTGGRALRSSDKLPDNPMEALVELYHDQVRCPHKRPNDGLFDLVAQEVKRLGIQGVIFKTLKFCHPWGFEARRFKEKLGLPFLHLDHDYSPSTTGQLRTRIHAFLEQLSFAR
jgi:benzoyl-CoA reductase/2-hydroxyglutaryl-CoA dehydratase subunit BcrC/BadD/HgdB